MAIDNKTLDALLHAFLDGQLSPNATKKVIKFLKEHPNRNDELQRNKKVKTYLHGAYNPVLDIPISERLQSILLGSQSMASTASGMNIDVSDIDFTLQAKKDSQSHSESDAPKEVSRSWKEIFLSGLHNHSGHIVLISSMVFFIGLVIGYLYPKSYDPDTFSKREFSENLALSAHLTYVNEQTFSPQTLPSNLSAFSELYSTQLGADISPVNLDHIGLELMGGHILPSLNEKAVFYMYKSVSNERLSLYIRRHINQTGASASYCYASKTNRLNICTWRGKTLTYFVVSDQPADTMNAIVQDISIRLNN